jgi:hypothetical protein
MNKKYDNNNIIIASRAYFLQLFPQGVYIVGKGAPLPLHQATKGGG